MIRDERIWAAGFFDGEGCISLRTGRNRKYGNYLRVTITQTDVRPLERFLAAVGVGSIEGPRLPTNGVGKKSYRRYVCQRKADVIGIFETLEPFLSEPKLEQFIRVFQEGAARAS